MLPRAGLPGTPATQHDRGGQPHLTAAWEPIPGKPLPEGLVLRGPDWPWAVEVEEAEEDAEAA